MANYTNTIIKSTSRSFSSAPDFGVVAATDFNGIELRMYGTYILLYANMCCNCCCCQHPPTGCIICGVRNNLTSDPAKHLAYCLIGLQAFRPAIVYCRNTCLTTSIFGICSGSLPIPPIYTVLTETRRASMSSAAKHRSLNYYG